jgi:hypothetical protein
VRKVRLPSWKQTHTHTIARTHTLSLFLPHSHNRSHTQTNMHTDGQVLFCSRTHSQLSQFIGQIQSSPFADIRAVLLASRASTCINDEVHAVSPRLHV